MTRAIKAVLPALMLVVIFGAAAVPAGQRPAKEVSDEELGIRKGCLDTEETVRPEQGEYPTSAPGKSKRIGRAFENSPPLVPHDLNGMLPISESGNACLGCHMPEFAKGAGAIPIPKTHLMNFESGADLKGRLDGKRYNCMQCHVPQANLPVPVKNEFKGEFRSEKTKTRSNLIDSLNEGVKAE